MLHACQQSSSATRWASYLPVVSMVTEFLSVSEDTSQLLLSAFTEELKLKQVIVQELAHTASFDLSMVYLSCWLHQPNIPPQSRLTLEALLLETGHRTL